VLRRKAFQSRAWGIPATSADVALHPEIHAGNIKHAASGPISITIFKPVDSSGFHAGAHS